MDCDRFPRIPLPTIHFVNRPGISPHSHSSRCGGFLRFRHTLAVAAPMPLSPCRIIAAYNRCASGVRAALPSYPFPRLPLTSGMSQFGPASGSLKETRGHIMTVACKRGLSALLAHNDFLHWLIFTTPYCRHPVPPRFRRMVLSRAVRLHSANAPYVMFTYGVFPLV